VVLKEEKGSEGGKRVRSLFEGGKRVMSLFGGLGKIGGEEEEKGSGA